MNEKLLQIYLADHSALLVAEIALIGRCRKSNRTSALGDFLQQLENDTRAQHTVLKDVAHRLGCGESVETRLKERAAWFAEKLGRFKRNGSLLRYSELSRLVELETLAAAAQERIALWDSLAPIGPHDARLEGISCTHFREQSQQHLEAIAAHRRSAAVEAFLDTAT